MSTVWRSVAVAAAVGSAVIHGALVPEHLDEQFYIGVLFAVGTVLLGMSAIGLMFRGTRRVGWWLGAGVSGGMFLGYVLSRTTGLPGGYLEEWGDPWGLASLVVEAAFLGAAALTARQAIASARTRDADRATGSTEGVPRGADGVSTQPRG